MKILCANQVSLEFDELNNKVRMGKKTVEIPGNVIMQSGDIVKIDGRERNEKISLFSLFCKTRAER